MDSRLIETKFHPPTWRAGSISRPRLLERLRLGLSQGCRLTLICAPAGYGKTTLAAEWIPSLPANLRLAWLSLDESDNDPARFLAYFLAAFRRIDPALGPRAQSLLEMPQLPPPQAILDELLNELAALPGPLMLVLDDLHLVHNPQLRQALEYFHQYQPDPVHLTLLSREDPPLPLARLRARRQMTEIRALDLRFTQDESRAFLQHSARLALDEDAIASLEARTEGWAAGLQLAALALQNLPDPQTFIATFRGSHRYVLDYLAEEVISQLGEDLRQFLSQTSVLERFNAQLCQAITGRLDSQALIQRLEQANLFVIPLDDERSWYRYHQLFAAFLRSGLSNTAAAPLYRKASAWHEANDLAFEAVQYALASQDSEFAADVISRILSTGSAWSGGNLVLLSSWLAALPAQAFERRPRLSLDASRLLYLLGRFDQAEERIAQTERALQALPPSPEVEQMQALAALYRGSIASVRGDVQQAIQQTSFAQSRLPRENHLAHARGFFSLGLAYEIADQTESAVQNYLQSSQEALSAGVLFLAIHARCAAAQVQIQQGRLSLAEQSCQAAIRLAEGARLPPLGLAWIVLGGIALERNDLASARQFLRDGIALARQGGLMDDVVLGLAYLARLEAFQGNTAASLAAIQEASAMLQSYGISRMLTRAAAYLTRLQLATGQVQAASLWAASYQAQRAATPSEFEDLTLARVLLATGELDAIPAILHPILEKAAAAGRRQVCIEAMILLALYHQTQNDGPAALDWLAKSLRLAAAEGYARLFLDEGLPLINLLTQARPAAPQYVDALLAMSQAEPAPHPAPASPPVEQLPDPLSAQELRVLQLIVAGKSNREIAAELVISVGTAKWHVHNVLQKLGARDRPQAIARARELGL